MDIDFLQSARVERRAFRYKAYLAVLLIFLFVSYGVLTLLITNYPVLSVVSIGIVTALIFILQAVVGLDAKEIGTFLFQKILLIKEVYVVLLISVFAAITAIMIRQAHKHAVEEESEARLLNDDKKYGPRE